MAGSALSRAFDDLVGSFNHQFYFVTLRGVQNRAFGTKDTKFLPTDAIDAQPLEKREQLVVIQTRLGKPNVLRVCGARL